MQEGEPECSTDLSSLFSLHTLHTSISFHRIARTRPGKERSPSCRAIRRVGTTTRLFFASLPQHAVRYECGGSIFHARKIIWHANPSDVRISLSKRCQC